MTPKSTSHTPAFVYHSEELGTSYAVHVNAPDPATEPGPWPLALFMDGDYAFDAAVRAYRHLREDKAVPPCVIAAIGYGHPFGSPANRRGRDYTPTAAPEEPGSGGADSFLALLAGPLWNELSTRHPLRTDLRLIAGHSLGALAALHALFQPLPFFNRVLAGAPSLWWDNRSLLRLAAAHREEHPSIDARLFLGIGMLDTESMMNDLALFEGQLAARPYADLEVRSCRLPGLDHYNAAPDLFHEGLRTLLGSAAA